MLSPGLGVGGGCVAAQPRKASRKTCVCDLSSSLGRVRELPTLQRITTPVGDQLWKLLVELLALPRRIAEFLRRKVEARLGTAASQHLGSGTQEAPDWARWSRRRRGGHPDSRGDACSEARSRIDAMGDHNSAFSLDDLVVAANDDGEV